MIGALGDPANAPFAVALAIMLALAILEAAGAIIGMALSRAVDAVLPDVLSGPDAIDLDVDAGLDTAPDLDSGVQVDGGHDGLSGGMPHTLTEAIGWLRIGRVPFLIFLIVALTAFGGIGLAMQRLIDGLAGQPLPASLAWMPALAMSLPVIRWAVGGLARLMPKAETSAVSRQAFVGQVATVVLGEARSGAPAQAKLVDQHGQVHYLLIEPDRDGEAFGTGQPALLVSMSGAVYRAVQPPHFEPARLPDGQ